MDQPLLGSVLIAGYLLIVASGVVWYFRGTLKGRRAWIAFDRSQKRLGVVYLIGFVLWFAAASAARPWAGAIGLEGHLALGIAPSFFAGVTVTAFITFQWRRRPILAVASGAALMVLIEVVQLWLPKYVFDPLDALAGVSGAALVALFLCRSDTIAEKHIAGEGGYGH